MTDDHDLDPTENPWVPIAFAAFLVGRKERTIRNWAADGIIAKRYDNGTVLVNAEDAAHESAHRPHRRRGPKPK